MTGLGTSNPEGLAPLRGAVYGLGDSLNAGSG